MTKPALPSDDELDKIIPDNLHSILFSVKGAKQQLLAWRDKYAAATADRALEKFRVYCYENHAFEAWDTPQSNRQGWLDTKLRDFTELTAKLNESEKTNE